ncbi:MAG TPA: MFS transporter [Pseudomonadota bacterium]|nr:MFS transporter [Pseudomonadota bacterium]
MAQNIPERTLTLLLGGIQFVNVLDFMMVTPLGPDFSAALGIPTSRLGLVTGSYAAAASLAGMLGTLFLDRFDRRSALGVSLAGLVIGTVAGGFATGLYTLLLARIVAGLFGGPATSLAISILTDLVLPERRGRAFGAVMGAFSVASVLGVPAGLWLSRHGGWRLPFFAVAGLGATLGAACVLLLPSVRGHLDKRDAAASSEFSVERLVLRREVVLALLTIAASMLSSFLIIPNMAAYYQYNCGVPRPHMEHIYAIGGVCSFIALRIVGRLVDMYGSLKLSLFGTGALLAVMASGFLFDRLLLPAEAVVALFMVAQSGRNIAATTLSARVPKERERARYQSLLSAVQHIASAVGAILGTLVLVEVPMTHRLLGIPRLAALSMLMASTQPILVWLIQGALDERDRRRAAGIKNADSLPGQ